MLKPKALLCLLAAFAIVAFGVATSQSAFANTSTSRSASASLSSSSQTFVSFSQFLTNVANARYSDYAGRAPASVQNEQAFGAMRSYILDTYAGVKQVSSFVLDGQYFDCITINSQSSVHHLNIKQIAQPPKVSIPTASGSSTQASGSPLTLGQKDEFGNSISCKDGTIPMERITLEKMVQFPTLQAFLAKSPGDQAATNAHRYAIGYQSVTNYGGNSWLNLWNPSGNFSLSQQWYVGGSGSGTQTVEGGWIHYPGKFGKRSVLFIYWTANDYQSTGCYNLDCTAFVQTNNNWALGGAFTNYSSYGGTQWGFTLQWKYYQGNWWLFLQGSGSIQAVGYYPGSIYRGGPLSKKSSLIEYGGETYTPTTNWPQMGSGKFASAGWQKAAFQKTIFYIPNNQSGGTGVWATLSPLQTNPKCYTIIITPSSSGGSWGTYFYFGGPGGYC